MKSSRSKAKTWPYPRHRHFRARVQEAAANWFSDQGLAVLPNKPYVLANWGDWQHNIILPEVAEYIEEVRSERAERSQGFPLHRSVHHGLSSQALLFNLIGPLIVQNDLGILASTLKAHGLHSPPTATTVELEYEDRAIFNEDYGQPTSIDLVLLDDETQPWLFVECKFVETGFGGCSVYGAGDCDGQNPAANFSLCYLHHIGRRYWTLMEKHGFLQEPTTQQQTCILSTHYQFFRCVVFAAEFGKPFLLLNDQRSPTFHCSGPQGQRGLLPLLLSLVPGELRSRVLSVSIQEVVSAVKASGRHPWIAEFERKYGLS
jgi:hypothetical protein